MGENENTNCDAKIINPYALFGLNENSKMTDLKKAYYTMSLLCHPDKGGNSEQMDTIVKAYKYIREQFENSNTRNKTYEELEKDFADFCKTQENEIPKFSNIYTETNEWIDEFNKEFIQKIYSEKNEILPYENDNNNHYEYDPFNINNGYGNMMDKSEYQNKDLDIEQEIKNKSYDNKDIEQSMYKFNKEIMIYEEPVPAPDYLDDKFPLDNKDIKNFSSKGMIDYEEALSEPNQINDTRIIRSNDEIFEDFQKLQNQRDAEMDKWLKENLSKIKTRKNKKYK